MTFASSQSDGSGREAAVKHRAAARQHLRPALRDVVLRHRPKGLGRAAAVWHAVEDGARL